MKLIMIIFDTIFIMIIFNIILLLLHRKYLYYNFYCCHHHYHHSYCLSTWSSSLLPFQLILLSLSLITLSLLTSIIINTVNSDHSHKNNTDTHNAHRTWQYTTCKEPVPRIPWIYRSHKALYPQVYFTPMPWMPYQHYPGITHWRGKCHIAQHSKRRSLSTKLVHSSCVTPELFLAHLLYNTPRTLPKLKILTS